MNQKDDCVSRQAVLEIVEREQNKGDALSEIEKLPPVTHAEKVGKWIPVSERLPEKCGYYLVSAVGCSVVESFYDGKKFWYERPDHWLTTVLAWMPLPEPYVSDTNVGDISCTDAISRKETLKALEKSQYSLEFCQDKGIDYSVNMSMVRMVLRDMPSVTPAEKVGKPYVPDTNIGKMATSPTGAERSDKE